VTQWASALPRRLWLISAETAPIFASPICAIGELGPVADQERHDVAARDADRLRPVREPVRRGVELVVAQRPVALDQRDALRAVLDLGLEAVGEGHGVSGRTKPTPGRCAERRGDPRVAVHPVE
jgi:hypothetical protein